MTAAVDDYTAIAARLRMLGGSRPGVAAAMPTRALHRPIADPGTLPSDPTKGSPSSGTGAQKTQPGTPDSDWSYCFWLAPWR